MRLPNKGFDWSVLSAYRIVDSRSSSYASITDEESATLTVRQEFTMRLTGIDDRLDLCQRQLALLDDVFRKVWRVGGGRRFDRGHGGRLNQLAKVGFRARHRQALWLVLLKNRVGEFALGLLLLGLTNGYAASFSGCDWIASINSSISVPAASSGSIPSRSI